MSKKMPKKMVKKMAKKLTKKLAKKIPKKMAKLAVSDRLRPSKVFKCHPMLRSRNLFGTSRAHRRRNAPECQPSSLN